MYQLDILTCSDESLISRLNPFVPNPPFLYPLKTSENWTCTYESLISCLSPFVPNAFFLYPPENIRKPLR